MKQNYLFDVPKKLPIMWAGRALLSREGGALAPQNFNVQGITLYIGHPNHQNPIAVPAFRYTYNIINK